MSLSRSTHRTSHTHTGLSAASTVPHDTCAWVLRLFLLPHEVGGRPIPTGQVLPSSSLLVPVPGTEQTLRKVQYSISSSGQLFLSFVSSSRLPSAVLLRDSPLA